MIFGDNRLPQRFWDKVQPEPNSGCWLWTASTRKDGRPQFRLGKKVTRPYQLTTKLEHGPCPDGKEHSHLCDQPLCVNPQHIIHETHQENSARKRGKPQSNRSFLEYAHLPPAEYQKATGPERTRAWRLRQKEAKCD